MTDLTTLDADLQRFWSNVERTETCWLWRGAIAGGGYGAFMTRRLDRSRQYWPAHRFAYTVTHGPIPEGLFVLHSCDVRACVNPDHLRVGTQLDNIHDAIARGRWKRPPLQREVRAEKFKLSGEDVRQIRALRQRGERVVDIAAKFSTSAPYISHILSGRKRWLD